MSHVITTIYEELTRLDAELVMLENLIELTENNLHNAKEEHDELTRKRLELADFITNEAE
mgnify:CR=1 FL=1